MENQFTLIIFITRKMHRHFIHFCLAFIVLFSKKNSYTSSFSLFCSVLSFIDFNDRYNATPAAEMKFSRTVSLAQPTFLDKFQTERVPTS